MKTYGDAAHRVASWVTGWAAKATGAARSIRLVAGWSVAVFWLAGLMVVVSATYVGRSTGHVRRMARLRNGVRVAQRRHRSAIRTAERKLSRLEKTHSKEVKSAKD